MGHAKDLNPSGQTCEQPRASPNVETLWTHPVLESSCAHRFAEDSTTAANGVGGGERSTTMTGNSIETLGATMRAAKSSKAEAGAARVVLESGMQGSVELEAQAAHAEMP